VEERESARARERARERERARARAFIHEVSDIWSSGINASMGLLCIKPTLAVEKKMVSKKARVMTVEEMNGTIRLLHKGGVTDDRPQDWRPVVLLNCTNQLVMHILNARLRSIVEKAGILELGQSGGRQGRSTDINLTKLEWVTREALTQGKRVYRVDVDLTNAFNAMSQAALWAVMRAYGIPDVDLLMSLYEHSTVRMALNDPQCTTITFDTGVAQGSALSPLL
jgi:hypothetical protein